MTYTAPTMSTLRGAGYASATWYLSVAPPSRLKIWTGTLYGFPAQGDPIITCDHGVLYNGAAWADIKSGQLLTVITSTGKVRRLRLKNIYGDLTLGSLEVQENSVVWANDQVLTIYRDYPLFGIRPKIDVNGIFYKDLNVPYVDQNQVPPPVAIQGPDWAGWVGETATLNGLASYGITVATAIVAWAWSVEPSIGAVIGDATAFVTTVTFSIAGPYWVRLDVTDANGKTSYTRALFHAHDSTYPPIAIKHLTYDSKFDSVSGPASFTVADEYADLDTLPNYGRLCVWSEDKLDGYATTAQAGWVGREHIKCAQRFIVKDSITRVPGSSTVEFAADSILSWLDRINNYSVPLNYTAAPTTWYQYGNSGITVAQAIHHLWKWHSTLFEVAPVILCMSNTSRCVATDDFERSSLLAQAKNLSYTHGIFAQIACNDQGVIHVEQDGQIFLTTIPTGFALAEGDWIGEMTIERQPIPETDFAQLSGFSFDGTTELPWVAQAPGDVIDDMGTTELEATRCILVDQNTTNAVVNRLLAKENNKNVALSVDLVGIVAVGNPFHVVPQEWHNLVLAPDDTIRGLDWSAGIDLLPRTIATTYDEGDVSQTITFEPYAEADAVVISEGPE